MTSARTVVISQPTLFPWRGVIEQMALADVFVHYDDVQFRKGWFMNRVQLKTAGGQKWMTIPTEGLHLGMLINDVQVASSEWRLDHERQFSAAYERAPFYADALNILRGVYAIDADRLGDIAMASVEAVGQAILGEQCPSFLRSSEMQIGGHGKERVLDVVRELGGDIYVSGHGGKNYLDHEQFEAAGIAVQYSQYDMTPYPQLHGDFIPYVTSLDLIANVGDEASIQIHPAVVDWKTFLTSE